MRSYSNHTHRMQLLRHPETVLPKRRKFGRLEDPSAVIHRAPLVHEPLVLFAPCGSRTEARVCLEPTRTQSFPQVLWGFDLVDSLWLRDHLAAQGIRRKAFRTRYARNSSKGQCRSVPRLRNHPVGNNLMTRKANALSLATRMLWRLTWTMLL